MASQFRAIAFGASVLVLFLSNACASIMVNDCVAPKRRPPKELVIAFFGRPSSDLELLMVELLSPNRIHLSISPRAWAIYGTSKCWEISLADYEMILESWTEFVHRKFEQVEKIEEAAPSEQVVLAEDGALVLSVEIYGEYGERRHIRLLTESDRTRISDHDQETIEETMAFLKSAFPRIVDKHWPNSVIYAMIRRER